MGSGVRISPLEFDLSVVTSGFLEDGALTERQMLLPLTAETPDFVQQISRKCKIIVPVTCPGDFTVMLYYVFNSISSSFPPVALLWQLSVLLDAGKVFIF